MSCRHGTPFGTDQSYKVSRVTYSGLQAASFEAGNMLMKLKGNKQCALTGHSSYGVETTSCRIILNSLVGDCRCTDVQMYICSAVVSRAYFGMIYLLTAVGLTPGGSSTAHIYTDSTQNNIMRQNN